MSGKGPHQVGIVGSPSSTTELTIDIVEGAIRETVLGDMVFTSHPFGESGHLIALGTVGEIETRNRWHEDPNMRGVLRAHGTLPHLSAEGDVRTADVTIQAVYRAPDARPPFTAHPMEEGGALGMSPTTGQPVCRVDQDLVDGLTARHGNIVYLGKIYRNDVKLPMFMRHFDDRDIDGAYHTGVFGLSGSGKTALVAHMLAMQMRHPELGVIVFDPQGQFSSEADLPFSLREWARSYGRPVKVLSIADDVRLGPDAPLFASLLRKTRFWAGLRVMTSDTRDSMGAEMETALQKIAKWYDEAPDALLRRLLDALNDPGVIGRVWAGKTQVTRVLDELQRALNEPAAFNHLLAEFRPVHSLFSATGPGGRRRVPLNALVQSAISPSSVPKPYIVIDLNSSAGHRWLDSEEMKSRLIHTIVKNLRWQTAKQWTDDKKGANCIVVFDEGHRFASSSPAGDDAHALAEYLRTAVRETRKVGIGWTFITQQIGSLHPDITSQLAVKAYGYGLTSGSDQQKLRDQVPSSGSLGLYNSFANPRSRVGSPLYPFMVTGPVSPLSFTAAPVFLEVFTDEDEFRTANGLPPFPH